MITANSGDPVPHYASPHLVPRVAPRTPGRPGKHLASLA
jgi:hypothetical protein